MRRRAAVAYLVITVTILTVSPSVVTQAASPEQEVLPWNRTPGCIATPVRNVPFSAEAVTAWYPPSSSGKAELRSTARYYRDRDGRVRVDFVGGKSRGRVIVTLGADSTTAHFLDASARTATKGVRQGLAMIVGGGCFNWFMLPLSVNRFVGFGGRPLDEEPLGERSMAGVHVTGTRFSTELPIPVTGMALDERWVSAELKLVVHGRREDSVIGVVEYQLRKISRTDPPAHLFEVPADYVEVRGTAKCWENPYNDPQRCQP